MSRLIFVFLVVLLLLTACSNYDPFEDSMRLGKDALLEEKYEEAVKQFDMALIEEPTNKDALALFDRANRSLEGEKKKHEIEKRELEMKKIIITYTNSREPIYNRILKISESIDEKVLTVLEKIKIKEEIDSVNEILKDMIHTEKKPGERTSLIDFEKNELDDKLLSAIKFIDKSFRRISDNPNSKYNEFGLTTAKILLEEWKEKTDNYK